MVKTEKSMVAAIVISSFLEITFEFAYFRIDSVFDLFPLFYSLCIFCPCDLYLLSRDHLLPEESNRTRLMSISNYQFAIRVSQAMKNTHFSHPFYFQFRFSDVYAEFRFISNYFLWSETFDISSVDCIAKICILMGECSTILSTSTMYRHLE